MFPLCLIRLSTYTMWNWQRRVSLAANRKFCFMGRSTTSWQLLLGHVVLSIEPQSCKESLGSSQCFFATFQCQMSYSGTFMSKVMLLSSMAVVGQWLALQEKKTGGNFRRGDHFAVVRHGPREPFLRIGPKVPVINAGKTFYKTSWRLRRNCLQYKSFACIGHPGWRREKAKWPRPPTCLLAHCIHRVCYHGL